MKRHRNFSILFWSAFMLLTLAACGALPSARGSEADPQQVISPSAMTKSAPVGTQANTLENSGGPSFWIDGQIRLDDQGSVVVEVEPLNLNSPVETLDFKVAMNTHSVDLSMDLSALATLTTDTGKRVAASVWDAPTGGHHVSGTLSFPAAIDNLPLLEGATRLTLTLNDVDAPQRVFEWNR